MEKETPTVPTEEQGVAPQVLQAANTSEILQRRTGHPVNQPAGEGFVSPKKWEVQWQEFLTMLESSHSPCGIPPLPEKPSPWEDARAFLASFEQVAEACWWPRDEWVIRLLPALSGEAAKAFNRVDARDKEDYGKVKAAILRREALNQEKQRQQFRCFCYQAAEGPRGAYTQLREMCRRWLRVENCSKEEILELLILEQLLSILPPEVQSRVRESGPESCSQVVALAEDFLLRQENQVSLNEEAAGWASETGKAPSESEQRHPFLDIKEEEGGEAGLLAGSIKETAGELQRSLSENDNEEDPEGNFRDPDGIRRKDRNYTDEKRDKPIPCQGGDFHEISDQDERPAKNRKKEDLHSNQRIYCKEKENERVACGKNFIQKMSIVSQEQICSREKLYSCSEYGKSFSRGKALSSCQRIHSGDDQQTEEDGELHELSSVKAQNQELTGNFKTLDRAKGEEGSHLAEKMCQPYLCQGGDVCEVMHIGEERYKCLECGMGFSDQTQYNSHLQKHSGKKIPKCLECEKSFSYRSELLKHLRTHSGKKPFECSKCGKSFRWRSDLQRHQRTQVRKNR